MMSFPPILSAVFLFFFLPNLIQPVLCAQHLSQTDSTGVLHLESLSESTFYAIVNDDFSNPYRIDTLDSLALPPGIYDIRIVKKLHKDVALQTRIEVNEVNRYHFNFSRLQIENLPEGKHLSSYPRLELRAKNAVRTDHDTEIYVNGERLGTGFALLNTDTHERVSLKLLPMTGKELKRELTLDNNNPFELHEYFLRPRQSTSIIYSFIPGLSQFYKRQKRKAMAIAGSQIVLSLSAYHYHRKMNTTFKDLKVTRATYEHSRDPERILQLADEMEHLNGKVNLNYKLRNSFIGAGIALYILNVLDGSLRTDDGFRKNISFDPYFDLADKSATVQMSLNF